MLQCYHLWLMRSISYWNKTCWCPFTVFWNLGSLNLLRQRSLCHLFHFLHLIFVPCMDICFVSCIEDVTTVEIFWICVEVYMSVIPSLTATTVGWHVLLKSLVGGFWGNKWCLFICWCFTFCTHINECYFASWFCWLFFLWFDLST